MKIRINKFLAQNNIASRRKSDVLIAAKRITINGNIAVLGDLVDDISDVVKIDGKTINTTPIKENYEYFLLNKPKEVLSTVTDDRGRKTTKELVNSKNRLYPIGRLDYDSTGLILLTNDGDLSYKMTHPKFHVPKTYIVTTREVVKEVQLAKLRAGGIPIDDKVTSRSQIEKTGPREFKMTIYEGIKRQIRMSCRYVDLHVIELKRVSIGKLHLGDLALGASRTLTKQELAYIKELKSK